MWVFLFFVGPVLGAYVRGKVGRKMRLFFDYFNKFKGGLSAY
jgi:hypothetical protein